MNTEFLALNSNAHASMVEVIKATTTLRECVMSDYVTNINEASKEINQEVQEWHNKYIKIDESPEPELFLSPENVKQLNNADSCVRSGEERLRILVEGMMAEHNNEISDDTLAAIRQIRIAIAKLRMAITNVIGIEKQLRQAVGVNESSFDMTEGALSSLEVATKSAYYR